MTIAREVHLARRPHGTPVQADFALIGKTLPNIGDGELVVENLLLSIDPYIRLRLDNAQPVGSVIAGSGLGRVVQSRHARFQKGDLVRHFGGFADCFVTDGSGLSPFLPDPELPLTAQLHALGGIGLCAYGGLIGIGQLKQGEQVFVSSAAGAVGSLAAQIAKIMDCYVVGSAGSDAKVAWLKHTLKLDAAINYKNSDIKQGLAAVTPNGLDVYFDNVGGTHLEAALGRMNQGGRIPVCGMISTYNGIASPVSLNEKFIQKRILIKGFGFTDFPALETSFISDMTRWIKEGRLTFYETILDGLERVPDALIGLFTGLNTGKLLVRLGN